MTTCMRRTIMGKGHGEKMSRKKKEVITALIEFGTIVRAAKETGVGESTIRRWLHEDEQFLWELQRTIMLGYDEEEDECARDAMRHLHWTIKYSQEEGERLKADKIALDYHLRRMNLRMRYGRLQKTEEVQPRATDGENNAHQDNKTETFLLIEAKPRHGLEGKAASPADNCKAVKGNIVTKKQTATKEHPLTREIVDTKPDGDSKTSGDEEKRKPTTIVMKDAFRLARQSRNRLADERHAADGNGTSQQKPDTPQAFITMEKRTHSNRRPLVEEESHTHADERFERANDNCESIAGQTVDSVEARERVTCTMVPTDEEERRMNLELSEAWNQRYN